jgi:hypothetical protein
VLNIDEDINIYILVEVLLQEDEESHQTGESFVSDKTELKKKVAC